MCLFRVEPLLSGRRPRLLVSCAKAELKPVGANLGLAAGEHAGMRSGVSGFDAKEDKKHEVVVGEIADAIVLHCPLGQLHLP